MWCGAVSAQARCRAVLAYHFTDTGQAEMEIKKGENLIEHEEEIFSRPARTWFQNEKDKQNAKGTWGHENMRECRE